MKDIILILDSLDLLYEKINDKEKLTFSIAEFDKRLFYQKLIFLLKEKVKQLDYHFNWYIRGPYCSDLTRDLYNLSKIIKQSPHYITRIKDSKKNNSVFNSGIKAINNLKEKFTESFQKEWTSHDLEILASLVFIEKYTYELCHQSKENTISELKERKPKLADEDLDKYWDVLQNSNYISVL